MVVFGFGHDDVSKWKHYPRHRPLWGESTGHRWIPSKSPVTRRSFDVFFDVRLNKRLSKYSRCRWIETPWRPLWHHGNVFFVVASCSFFHVSRIHFAGNVAINWLPDFHVWKCWTHLLGLWSDDKAYNHENRNPVLVLMDVWSIPILYYGIVCEHNIWWM